ncbi:MAG: prenyltransferase/squalene oxidase repeat-containing protein [Planctomycetota bacterium]|jgi:hypothetical protein
MARRLTAILLLAAVAGAGPSLESRVKAGVENGISYLLSRYDEKEGWGKALGNGVYGGVGQAYPYSAGPTALVCFALLKAGVSPEDKTLRKAFTFLRVRHRTPGVAYELSVELLAVAELGGAKTSPDFRLGALRKERTDHRFRKPKKSPFKTKHWTWMADLAKKLISFQSRNGGWRYYPNDFHSGGVADTSSTQFAMLALSTASRCGYQVPDEVFAKARRFLIEAQADAGLEVPRAIHVPGGPADARDRARGFPYIAGSTVMPYRRVSGGMTAAGVASLLLCREEMGGDEEMEQAILDGFAWLGRYFTVRVNPGMWPFSIGSYHFTYLYALERCGDIGKREVIGGRSWFAEGARHLLSIQREDGAFADPTCMRPEDSLGTAFALLFLTRASRPITPTGN